MLEPEESQTIEDFIKTIEDIDEEAIRETNDKLEKVDGVPRLVCKDYRKSFSHNYGTVTYMNTYFEQKWHFTTRTEKILNHVRLEW